MRGGGGGWVGMGREKAKWNFIHVNAAVMDKDNWNFFKMQLSLSMIVAFAKIKNQIAAVYDSDICQLVILHGSNTLLWILVCVKN